MADPIVREIKDRLDIADVIGGYIPLKKAGTNFKALCPFHGERTPSFVVTPSRQIWHCFGCGEGGDVFTFVQKYESLDFPETLKLLADRANVKLPEYRPAGNEREDEKALLIRINTFAARYYHQVLLSDPNSAAARQYLSQRGLRDKTIDSWQIGFAPSDFHSLSKALAAKKVKETDAIKAGVLVKNEKGRVYDRFRGRVTFPVFNYVGDVVGFSARILPALDDGKSGKYINSPETPIYNKSKVLFGLNFAKTAIRKSGEAIIVEGQMDCISAHQAGFLNTVASSGTALASDQVNILGRLAKTFKFCFDADQAGLNATRRAVENILGKDYAVKVVSITGAKDPDELIRQNPKAWQSAVDHAQPFLDYYIQQLFKNVSSLSIETKKQLGGEILPLIKKLPSALEREHYIKLLAPKLETTPASLTEDMNRNKSAPALQKQAEKSGLTTISPLAEAEKLVLGGMLEEAKFKALLLKEGSVEDFSLPEIRPVVEHLFASPGSGLNKETAEATLVKECIFMVQLLKEESASAEAFQKDLTKAFLALRVNTLKKQQHELQSQIAGAEKNGSADLVLSLQKQFAEISKLIDHYNK